jgi:hypothetical protein
MAPAYGKTFQYKLSGPVGAGGVSYHTSLRRPNLQIADLAMGGNHAFTHSFLHYQIAVAHSRFGGAAGNPGADFGSGAGSDCGYSPATTVSKFRPQYTCDNPNDSIADPTQYTLSDINLTTGQATQLNHHRAARRDGQIRPFAIDLKGNRLFIAATGNHSVEVLDLASGKVVESFSALGKPHGLAWVASTGRLYVADGAQGDLKILEGSPLRLARSITLSHDADDMVFDAKTQLLYVGHGGSDAATLPTLRRSTPRPSRCWRTFRSPRIPKAWESTTPPAASSRTSATPRKSRLSMAPRASNPQPGS